VALRLKNKLEQNYAEQLTRLNKYLTLRALRHDTW